MKKRTFFAAIAAALAFIPSAIAGLFHRSPPPLPEPKPEPEFLPESAGEIKTVYFFNKKETLTIFLHLPPEGGDENHPPEAPPMVGERVAISDCTTADTDGDWICAAVTEHVDRYQKATDLRTFTIELARYPDDVPARPKPRAPARQLAGLVRGADYQQDHDTTEIKWRDLCP